MRDFGEVAFLLFLGLVAVTALMWLVEMSQPGILGPM